MCISKKELEEKVAEYRKYKTIKEEAEAIVKSLEKDIEAYMEEIGQDDIHTDDAHITYKECSRKGNLDEDLMILDGIDVESFRRPATNYMRFTLK